MRGNAASMSAMRMKPQGNGTPIINNIPGGANFGAGTLDSSWFRADGGMGSSRGQSIDQSWQLQPPTERTVQFETDHRSTASGVTTGTFLTSQSDRFGRGVANLQASFTSKHPPRWEPAYPDADTSGLVNFMNKAASTNSGQGQSSSQVFMEPLSG